MMPIGEFSRYTGLSIKTLRFYDGAGLLPAAEVDQANGYRYYSVRQLRDATIIRVLRATGMPMDTVSQALREPDIAPTLMAGHRHTLDIERASQDRALTLAHTIFDDNEYPTPVKTRYKRSTHWAAIATTVHIENDDTDDPDWADAHFALLHTALERAGNAPTGTWWTTTESIDSVEETRLLLCWPVAHPISPELSVDGVELASGVLPDRQEAYVQSSIDGVTDYRLDDTPNGQLLHPAFTAFAEYLDDNDIAPTQIRQTTAHGGGQDHPAVMELSATIDPHESN